VTATLGPYYVVHSVEQTQSERRGTNDNLNDCAVQEDTAELALWSRRRRMHDAGARSVIRLDASERLEAAITRILETIVSRPAVTALVIASLTETADGAQTVPEERTR